ncbi:MAG: ATP synthase F0 subunit A [Candidatus Levybacteria bacterium RIFCSPHIGHO2_12_FULL_37_12]|nr:MAG: ATP synthase F0 subunit A [Candidatus Levybacteria bacterium RIFCSPHIGHO2_12_FULL_37_12]OGH33181.1 MAG: ATP synthase F0 subunit A [Candidatus Levybacteria bacterium RIFCSPLOWO2_01_FULL_36_54]
MMFSFRSEAIFYLGDFRITNTIIDTLLVDAIIIIASFMLVKSIRIIPGLYQNTVEMVIQTFYEMTESVAQEKAAKIFPYFMSFFIFILLANWSGLLPGVNSIGFFEKGKLIPLLRSPTSDLNTTLGLALVSVAATHILSIRTVGFKDYLSRFFSFNPMNLFIGALEIISEITKVISLSFRLFGNIFAGEVVLLTVSSIFAFLFPLPFLLLEVVVGLVQALVFSMLTMAFMAILTIPHHDVSENANKAKHLL